MSARRPDSRLLTGLLAIQLISVHVAGLRIGKHDDDEQPDSPPLGKDKLKQVNLAVRGDAPSLNRPREGPLLIVGSLNLDTISKRVAYLSVDLKGNIEVNIKVFFNERIVYKLIVDNFQTPFSSILMAD